MQASDEFCEECFEPTVKAWLNHNDDSVIEYECRTCGAYWVDSTKEVLAYGH